MPENANSSGSAREEAERLVAAALAAASVAARGIARNASPLAGIAGTAERLLAGSAGGHVATGSAECCVCPLCRAITAVRDPSPELALKLASGASDLASGLTGMLRSVSDLMSATPAGRPGPEAPGARRGADPDSVWHTATTRRPDRPGQRPADRTPDERSAEPADLDPWHAATTAPFPPAGTPEPTDEPAPPDAG